MGAGYCRNLAIENSSSKYLAFIDSDDIWMEINYPIKSVLWKEII